MVGGKVFVPNTIFWILSHTIRAGRKMSMKVLCTDLDNTLIYSYKHNIGIEKRNVEIYQGREISFITAKTYELLRKLKQHMRIIPTTTRTIEQYERIELGVGGFSFALVCNGGILLRNGKRDEEWYHESLRRITDSVEELERAIRFLEQDARRKFEIRFIEKMFVFTKCRCPDLSVRELKECLNPQYVDVFHNGEKVYVIPVGLSKGTALDRIRSYLDAEMIYAAGDSAFDVSLLDRADAAFAPYGFSSRFGFQHHVREFGENVIFSDAFLEACLRSLDTRKK